MLFLLKRTFLFYLIEEKQKYFIGKMFSFILRRIQQICENRIDWKTTNETFCNSPRNGLRNTISDGMRVICYHESSI